MARIIFVQLFSFINVFVQYHFSQTISSILEKIWKMCFNMLCWIFQLCQQNKFYCLFKFPFSKHEFIIKSIIKFNVSIKGHRVKEERTSVPLCPSRCVSRNLAVNIRLGIQDESNHYKSDENCTFNDNIGLADLQYNWAFFSRVVNWLALRCCIQTTLKVFPTVV